MSWIEESKISYCHGAQVNKVEMRNGGSTDGLREFEEKTELGKKMSDVVVVVVVDAREKTN